MGSTTIDPRLVSDLIEDESGLDRRAKETRRMKRARSALLDFHTGRYPRLKKILFDPRNIGRHHDGHECRVVDQRKMNEWLGERTRGYAFPVRTQQHYSEMGLALLDIADVICPYPEVIDYLEQCEGRRFLEELAKFDGGQQARDASGRISDKYGMRCAGEIDMTRTRWSEKPTTLVPLISAMSKISSGAGRAEVRAGSSRSAVEGTRTLIGAIVAAAGW